MYENVFIYNVMYDNTAVLTISLTTDCYQPRVTNEAATWTEVFPF